MIDITKDNIDALLDAGKICAGMRNGAWWRIRRNGATKRWKKDATRIYVPFKAGLKSYGALTETDFMPHGHLRADCFQHVDDLDAAGIKHT